MIDLDHLPTDAARLNFLQAEIMEASRLLSLRGKRPGLVKEIRSLAADHLRIQLQSATRVLAIDGDRFGDEGTLIEIERDRALVRFDDGEQCHVPWRLLREALEA